MIWFLQHIHAWQIEMIKTTSTKKKKKTNHGGKQYKQSYIKRSKHNKYYTNKLKVNRVSLFGLGRVWNEVHHRSEKLNTDSGFCFSNH